MDKWEPRDLNPSHSIHGGSKDSLICDNFDKQEADTFLTVQAQHIQDMVKAMVVKFTKSRRNNDIETLWI